MVGHFSSSVIHQVLWLYIDLKALHFTLNIRIRWKNRANRNCTLCHLILPNIENKRKHPISGLAFLDGKERSRGQWMGA